MGGVKSVWKKFTFILQYKFKEYGGFKVPPRNKNKKSTQKLFLFHPFIQFHQPRCLWGNQILQIEFDPLPWCRRELNFIANNHDGSQDTMLFRVIMGPRHPGHKCLGFKHGLNGKI